MLVNLSEEQILLLKLALRSQVTQRGEFVALDKYLGHVAAGSAHQPNLTLSVAYDREGIVAVRASEGGLHIKLHRYDADADPPCNCEGRGGEHLADCAEILHEQALGFHHSLPVAVFEREAAVNAKGGTIE